MATQETVSIVGLDKADVLAALYNASSPQGMGFLHYDPKPMTHDEAEDLLAQRGADPYFDYLKGRVMKIRIAGDELSAWGYDRDNGQGACAAAIQLLRDRGETNPEETELAHLENTRNAAIRTSEHLYDETGITASPGHATVHLGLSDVADVLKPHLENVLQDDDTDSE